MARLLAAGAPVDAADRHGRTALMAAAGAGQAEVVTSLLVAGSRSDASDHNGASALMFAAEHGHVAVIAALVRAGAGLEQHDLEGQRHCCGRLRPGRWRRCRRC